MGNIMQISLIRIKIYHLSLLFFTCHALYGMHPQQATEPTDRALSIFCRKLNLLDVLTPDLLTLHASGNITYADIFSALPLHSWITSVDINNNHQIMQLVRLFMQLNEDNYRKKLPFIALLLQELEKHHPELVAVSNPEGLWRINDCGEDILSLTLLRSMNETAQYLLRLRQRLDTPERFHSYLTTKQKNRSLLHKAQYPLWKNNQISLRNRDMDRLAQDKADLARYVTALYAEIPQQAKPITYEAYRTPHYGNYFTDGSGNSTLWFWNGAEWINSGCVLVATRFHTYFAKQDSYSFQIERSPEHDIIVPDETQRAKEYYA